MRPPYKRCSPLTLGLLASLLSACGGGGGGTGGDQPADPVQEDIAIAYISRNLPADLNENTQESVLREDNLLEPADFRPGARLIVRARATPGAQEKIITDRIYGTDAQYDVKDLEVSYDGGRLLFSMRAPEIEGAPDDEQPTWDIWEYNIDTDELRRVIASDVAEAQGQDVNPRYLPDGRIVFSSTRQLLAKSNQLDEGKPQYNPQGESSNVDQFALHVMNSNGSNITQLTFNSSHEMSPIVNNNGEIVYLRWDNIGPHNSVDLYSIRPDGTGHQHLYGGNSHNSGTEGASIEYRHLQQAPDGRLLALIGPRTNTVYGGQLIYLDPNNFSDNAQPVPDSTSSAATAQTDATHFPIRSDAETSLGGYISAAYPLWDGTSRMLISWSECLVQSGEQTLPCTTERVEAESATVLPPAYGLWMYQTDTETLRPLIVPQPDRLYTDIAVMQPRLSPPILPSRPSESSTYSSELAEEKAGMLHIRSVYDLDGMFSGEGSSATTLAQMRRLAPAQRPARFLRLEKAVLRPDNDVREVPGTAYGRAGGQRMRDIIGYAPIEPDGSVKVKVTANVPFTLSVLDQDGQSISPRHQYWLQVAAGEIMTCNGCHESGSTTPHGRTDARPASINQGPTRAGAYTGLNSRYVALAGETMAETRTRIDQVENPENPTADIVFNDVWSVTPAASFAWRYSDLDNDSDPANDSIEVPTNASCEPVWTPLCRITIHYPVHIAPLWERQHAAGWVVDGEGDDVLDDDGNPVDQCTDCHSQASSLFGDLPYGVDSDEARTQLDLTNEPSTDEEDHVTSYRELLYGGNAKQYDDEGNLIDKPRRDGAGNIRCRLDDNGDPIVDADTGECVDPPMIETVPALMDSAGAGAAGSERFFAPFRSGGSHEGRLTPAELKMISEWLDIGGQYYNDPFAIPQG